jgi:hypothetical protein
MLSAVITASMAFSSGIPQRMPAVHSSVSIEGRFQALGDGSVVQAYPGVLTRIRFNGSKLVMFVSASTDDVSIDVSQNKKEWEFVALRKGEQSVVLFDGDFGNHEVVVNRRVEAWQGVMTIHWFESDGTGIVPPAEMSALRLLFIGDSITCGASADIRPGWPETGAVTSNGRLAYGKLIASELGAQCHLVSYGGRGVVRDWQANRRTNNAPDFYELALPDDPNAVWDHGQFIPDLVSICLGTNDFSRGIPDQDEWVNAYTELVRKILRDAPESQVVLLESPMFGFDGEGGAKRTALSYYLDEVLRKLNRPNVHKLELGHYPGRPEDAHPVWQEHEAMASVLLPRFRMILDTGNQ